jgi:hypothetical protein
MITWYIESIDSHIEKIKELFSKNIDHRLAHNYLKMPLFEYTKFARMGYCGDRMIYYSAGIERPQYNGSIRIMSRHTRDRNFIFGSKIDDLNRGLETLELSVDYAKNLGYKDIWLSREFSSELFKWFSKKSKFEWTISYESMHYRGYQHILRLKND